MFKRVLIFTGFIVLAPLLQAQLSPEAKEVAAAVSTQFETVGYVTTDFLDVDLNTGMSPRYLATALPLRWPFMVLLAGLKGLDPDSVAAVEKNYSAFVAGANNFVPLHGLGMAGSSQCFVGISQGVDQPDVDSYFKRANLEQITGVETWTWLLSAGEAYPHKQIKFYAAQVGHSLEVCDTVPLAKGQEYAPINSNPFIGLNVQLKLGSATLTIPDSLTSHSLWLYRFIVQRTDPGGALDGAKSLALYTDFADNDHATVNFEVVKDPTSTNPPELETSPSWSTSKAGVWVSQVNLEKGKFTKSTDQVADMVSRFGFAVSY